jgi:hypothetical protein
MSITPPMLHTYRGPFENFMDWRQFSAVMQNEAVAVTPSFSGGGKVVVV